MSLFCSIAGKSYCWEPQKRAEIGTKRLKSATEQSYFYSKAQLTLSKTSHKNLFAVRRFICFCFGHFKDLWRDGGLLLTVEQDGNVGRKRGITFAKTPLVGIGSRVCCSHVFELHVWISGPQQWIFCENEPLLSVTDWAWSRGRRLPFKTDCCNYTTLMSAHREIHHHTQGGKHRMFCFWMSDFLLVFIGIFLACTSKDLCFCDNPVYQWH